MAFEKKEAQSIKRGYINLKNCIDQSVHIDKSVLWLKSGKYATVSASVNIDDTQTLSDWLRTIELENVDIEIGENDKGYPVMKIKGK